MMLAVSEIPKLTSPDEMAARIRRWRRENATLCADAERCEEKTVDRLVVEMPTAHRPAEFRVDRDRIFTYVKKRRKVVAGGLFERFVPLPFLPTLFDRSYARQQRNAVDFYADVRELTPIALVMRTVEPDVASTSAPTLIPTPTPRRIDFARFAS